MTAEDTRQEVGMGKRKPKEPVTGPKCGDTEGTDRAAGEDEICSDEVDHGRGPEDPGMLDGSVVDTGGAIQGLMPVELPKGDGADEGGSGGCGECE
jgi:hypothetical protein